MASCGPCVSEPACKRHTTLDVGLSSLDNTAFSMHLKIVTSTAPDVSAMVAKDAVGGSRHALGELAAAALGVSAAALGVSAAALGVSAAGAMGEASQGAACLI